MSFVDMYHSMAPFIDDKKRRFKFVLRVKRGFTDTSEPGGVSKDQCYLEGAIKILKLRNQIDFKAMHSAKLAVEDVIRPPILK